MMGLCSIVVLLLFFCISFVISENQQYEGFKNAFPNVDISRLEGLPDSHELVANIEPEIPFNCPTLDPPAPTDNVNTLKPGHIKVVMAMGDSITAGMSVKDSTVFSLHEYRGVSYSIGADIGVTTMPNILKHYSPQLYGGSTGVGDVNSPGCGFNVAKPGAKNKDMLGQATFLVHKLRNDPKVNIKRDWKLLTIWIGSNNLCDVCVSPGANGGDDFQHNLEITLDYLSSNVDKLFVNIVGNLDIATLYNIKDLYCSVVHKIVCYCASSLFPNVRAKVTQTTKDYVARANLLSNKYRRQNKPGFAVVVQPFLTQTKTLDRSLLSSADCFHPSSKGHQTGSVALWNNMISPSNLKKTSWNPSDAPKCADANTRLFTY